MKENYCQVDKLEILNQPIGPIGFFNYEHESIMGGRSGVEKMFYSLRGQR